MAEHGGQAEDRDGPDAAPTQRQRRRQRLVGATAIGIVSVVVAILALGRDVLDITVADLRHPPSTSPGSVPAAPGSGPSVPDSSAPRGTTTTASPAVAASIVTPADGGTIPLCTVVAGTVSELTGNRAVWLLVRGIPPAGPSYYLVQRLTTTVRRAPNWKTDRIQIGTPANPGQKFELLLLGTDGDLTDEYVQRLKRNTQPDHYVQLPQNRQILDQVVITVGDEEPC